MTAGPDYASRDPLDALVHDVAARSPDAVALILGDRRVTYGEVQRLADDLSGRLRTHGVGPGERVLLVSNNSIEYLIAAVATWRIGAVLATVYPTSGAAEFTYALDNARPTLILADESSARSLREHVPALATDLFILGGAGTVLGLAPAWRHCEYPKASDRAPAVICYTSGSTSRPKPVTLSRANLVYAARTYGQVWHMSAADTTFVCLPMAWAYGLVTASLTTLGVGGTVVVQPRFQPESQLQTMQDLGVTVFLGVTTMYVKLVAAAAAQPRPDLSALRLCVSAGEPRNEAAFRQWQNLSGRPVHDLYAASEYFPGVTYDPLVDRQPRPGASGRLVPGMQMRVLDAQGAPVAPGEAGEAYWRGPGLMLEYWGEPELTAAAITPDGWYRTRDLVRVDDEGYLHVLGRLSDMIIRGGANVAPAEVEAVLAEHPDVVAAAVVGLPDAEYGQCVAAAIVLRPGVDLDADALAGFCRGRLAGYKVPSSFHVVATLPRNATGKVSRRDVIALVSSGDE